MLGSTNCICLFFNFFVEVDEDKVSLRNVPPNYSECVPEFDEKFLSRGEQLFP